MKKLMHYHHVTQNKLTMTNLLQSFEEELSEQDPPVERNKENIRKMINLVSQLREK